MGSTLPITEVTPGSYWKLLPLKMGSTLPLREAEVTSSVGVVCFPFQGKQLPITAWSDPVLGVVCFPSSREAASNCLSDLSLRGHPRQLPLPEADFSLR